MHKKRGGVFFVQKNHQKNYKIIIHDSHFITLNCIDFFKKLYKKKHSIPNGEKESTKYEFIRQS